MAMVNDRDVMLQATSPRYTLPTDRTILLTSSAPQFKFNTAGVPDPSSIVLVATPLGMSGNVTFVASAGLTLSGVTGSEATLLPANMAAASGTVKAQLTVDGQLYESNLVTILKLSDGAPGLHALSAELSNATHALPADTAGVVTSYANSGTELRVYEGPNLLAYDGVGTANGTWKATLAVTNVTAGALTDSGDYLTVGAHSGVASGTDTASIVFTITGKTATGAAFSMTKVQTLTKAKTGATGSAGQSATVYRLAASVPAIQKSVAGAYTPGSVTFTATSATGTAAPAAYAGRFIIATSTDGTTYTDQYTSAADESSKAYTVPAGIKTIRVRLYLAGGTSTLVDEEILTVVSDGATGATGSNGLSVAVSNGSHVFPADVAGAVSSYTSSGTEIRVYEGATELAYDGVGTANGTWKVTTTATNITVGSLTDSGSYLTVGQHSGVAAATDVSSINYSITGKTAAGASFTLPATQTFSKSKTGATGAAGSGGLSAAVTNSTHAFPADATGAVTSYANSGTEVHVYEGATELAYDGVGTANGTWKVTTTAANITVGTLTDSGVFLTVGPHSGVAAATDTSSVTYTITGKTSTGVAFSLPAAQTFTKAKSGTAGQSATAYRIASSVPAIQKSVAGVYTPGSVTFTATAATGTSAPAAYAGRFIIATSTDGTAYTDQYTSAADESSKAYTVPAGIKTIRVRLYLAGGTATLVDEQTLTVVSDGATGASTYTWIKYATSITGANLSDSSLNRAFIGIAQNKSTSVESTDPLDYTWALVGGATSPNLAHQLKDWTLESGATYGVDTANIYSTDGSKFTLTAAASAVLYTDYMRLEQGVDYTLSFNAVATVAGSPLIADLWPDTLPQTNFTIGTTEQQYTATWNSTHVDMTNCRLRLLGGSTGGAITVTDVKLEKGSKVTAWNASTYSRFRVDVGADTVSNGARTGSRSLSRTATLSGNGATTTYQWALVNGAGTGASVAISGSSTSQSVTLAITMIDMGEPAFYNVDVKCTAVSNGQTSVDTFLLEVRSV